MGKQKKAKAHPGSITQNKKARFDYHIEDRLEAGLSLMGWEVKSLREGRVNLSDSYVVIHQGEAFLHGCHISPLTTASTHVDAPPLRPRKLLMHRRELNVFIGKVERKGYTIVALGMYWSKGKVKLEIALGKGKKEFDKRATEKERDWNREKSRVLRDR